MDDLAVPVLVVEDDGLLVLPIEDALREAGYQPIVAQDGNRALEVLDGSDSFRAIVTDIRLRRGPDGWEIARHARESAPDIPVIYVSGDSAADWPINGVPNSVMLQKPFALGQLLTALANLLNAPTTSQ